MRASLAINQGRQLMPMGENGSGTFFMVCADNDEGPKTSKNQTNNERNVPKGVATSVTGRVKVMRGFHYRTSLLRVTAWSLSQAFDAVNINQSLQTEEPLH